MLSAEGLASRIELCNKADPKMLSIVRRPELGRVRADGAASLDLRLGRWFRSLRPSRTHLLDLSKSAEAGGPNPHSTKEHFVPFGEIFVLHPHNFVPGITLEWIRIPTDLAGYVTGKSSVGRRGLIIETAAGIQPGFSGCLALELSDVGEVPLALFPGMRICQVFLHEVAPEAPPAKSQFAGRRKPVLGDIREDPVLTRLGVPAEPRA
jgi:dCTP deaminase